MLHLFFCSPGKSLSLWKKKEALLWIQEPFSGIFDSSVFSAREYLRAWCLLMLGFCGIQYT
ncbi:hypothetical protein C1H46_004884 [Malus baccata]|uniref:Uncharacterized protein n=1 Tax=Malus baccata TaxID=106549 RepID=A0A540NEW0_MALBA|nr:hypothetical protein C1H46_004884 [Malus baccata]